MIYGIWYPSGGFGHFINAMISLYGDKFCRPAKGLILGTDGNSHSVPLVLPKITLKNLDGYRFPEINDSLNRTVLVDFGINSENTDFLDRFPDLVAIKICYTDHSWPIIAATHVIKALQSSLQIEASVDTDLWSEKSDWAQREKFFLYLRDHCLRHRWRRDERYLSIQIDQLTEYHSMVNALRLLDINLDNFHNDWQQWWQYNSKYFDPVIQAKKTVDSIAQKKNLDLTHITDIWTQSVVYYFIWLHFGIEVPHNQFPDFFANTDDIRSWLA